MTSCYKQRHIALVTIRLFLGWRFPSLYCPFAYQLQCPLIYHYPTQRPEPHSGSFVGKCPSDFSWEDKWKWKSLSRVWLFETPWNSLGQNIGVGRLSLLQGIFPTQGLKPGLSHCRWILYQLSHKGSPRILEWVAYPFSRGSSQPRNWTRVSCTAGRFFTNWAIREARNKQQSS